MKNQKLYIFLVLIIATLFSTACTGVTESAVQPTATVLVPTPAPTATALPPTPAPTPVPPTPDINPFLQMDLSGGDADQGQNVAIAYECWSCHNSSSRPDRAPHLGADEGLLPIMQRAEQRIADPAYGGRAATNQEYIIESIFIPEAYTAPGEWRLEMPIDYAEKISEEELVNLMAWLASLSESETE